LFDALLFTKLACDSVECKTIENCFSHAFKNAEIADFNDRVLDESEDRTTATRTADLDDQLFLEQIYIYIYIYKEQSASTETESSPIDCLEQQENITLTALKMLVKSIEA
jgi:hypothetical protein